ncbi:MAG: DUF6418 domain-containing protein [Caldimonas sp.]
MISLLSALGAGTWLLRSFSKNRAFLLVAIFLAWQFMLKVLGVVFLDVAGPIYSDEVFTEVGGVGASAPLMILFVLIPLVLLKLAFSRFSARSIVAPEKHLDRGGVTFGDIAFGLFSVFVCCLFVDLIRIGNIPFFNQIERFEYKGGVFHDLLVSYLFLIAYVIGYILARGRILTGRWDLRFAAIILSLFVYLFLVGHRFGSFYVLISFCLVPLAALWVAPRCGIAVAPAPKRRSALQRFSTSRSAITLFGIVLASFVLVAMANSLLNVRDNDVGDSLLQRLLVQPVHLYWLTWERLVNGQIEGISAATQFLSDPFDAARNTGIQYLMFLHLGLDRASQVFEGQEVDYAGGYPEILIEVGGVPGAILAAVAVSLIMVSLYRLCVVSVCRGHFLSSVLSMYVCFGVLNLFLGGMVSFFLAGTYWFKIVALLVVIWVDRSLARRGRRLFPWIAIPRVAARRRPRVAGQLAT